MRPLAFIFQRKFVPGYRRGEKKFERWKIVVIGLIIIAVGLLISALILSGKSKDEEDEEEEEEDEEDEEDLTGDDFGSEIETNFNSGTKSSEEDVLQLFPNLLPMARIYCSIVNCVVTCSFIPAASNPGLVAAVLTISDYKSYCPENLFIEELTFADCKFPDDGLTANWFPGNLELKKLNFRRCSLAFVGAAAFNSWHYRNLKSLSLTGNRITSFRKSSFDHLTNLEEMVIENNAMDVAESDLLAGTANALETLQIDNSIRSEATLTNVTGRSTLRRVVLLSLTGNSITKISSGVFKGVPNLQSLYLTNSGILKIEHKAFEPFSRSVRQIFLSDNKISSLPRRIFQSIIDSNPNFRCTLGNNEWNCNCDLKWLQNLTSGTSMLNDQPRCSRPENNNMLTFSEAKFCGDDVWEDGDASPNPTSGRTEVTPLDEDRNTITLLCDKEIKFTEKPNASGRKLLSIRELNFQSRLATFAVDESENGSTYVSIGTTSTSSSYTLIWFSDKIEEPATDTEEITCMTNVRNSVYLNDLESDKLYTICILDVYLDVRSPFDCVSFKKRSKHGDKLWLSNREKTGYIIGLILVLIMVCMVSVTLSCYVVRKNPRLLKGSKRVIMVNHKTADAIILPEGFRDVDDRSKRTDYVAPLKKRPAFLNRNDSIVSGTSSSGGYVTGIEPTDVQLMSWRIERIRNILSCDENYYSYNLGQRSNDNPPPLPPPRNKSLPSVSSMIDKKTDADDDDERIVSVTLHNVDGSNS